MQNFNRQEQIELFSSPLEDAARNQFNRRSQFLSINLSLENLILIAILSVMLIVVSFSLGVEKGKKVSIKTVVQVEPVKPMVAEKKAVSRPVLPAQTVQPKQLTANLNKFTVQVASAKKGSSIQSEADKLKKLGYDTWIFSDGKFNRLYVGHFASKEEALALLKNLKKIYNDSFIRRLENANSSHT